MRTQHTRRHVLRVLLPGSLIASSGRVDGAITSATILKRARRFTWIETRTGGIDLSIEAGSRAEREIEDVKRWLGSAQERIGQVLGEPLQPRVRAFIAGSLATSKALIGRPLNGFAIAPIAVMVYSDSVNAIGPHELCHAWANSMWGASSGTWVDEGLAVHSDGHWQSLLLHDVAKWLLDRGRLVPISELTKKKWNKTGYTYKITYPESGSFVKFIFEKYGRDAVKALWQRGVNAAAEKGVLGKPLRAVESEWLHELSKIDASGVQYAL